MSIQTNILHPEGAAICLPGASTAVPSSIDELRERIDQVDRELLQALARRAELARAIGRLKRAGRLPVLDPAREARVVRQAVGVARELCIPDEEVRDLVWRTLALCRAAQAEPPQPGP